MQFEATLASRTPPFFSLAMMPKPCSASLSGPPRAVEAVKFLSVSGKVGVRPWSPEEQEAAAFTVACAIPRHVPSFEKIEDLNLPENGLLAANNSRTRTVTPPSGSQMCSYENLHDTMQSVHDNHLAFVIDIACAIVFFYSSLCVVLELNASVFCASNGSL